MLNRRASSPVSKLYIFAIAVTLLLIPTTSFCTDRFRPLSKGDGIEVSSPEKMGFNVQLLSAAFDKAAQLPYAHSLLVVKDGKLIAEEYFNGHDAQSPNNLKSVTKSVMSALIGIALDQGILRSVDLAVLDFFPEVASKIDNRKKKQITLKHFLTMSAGLDANDDLPELTCSAHLDSAKCVFARPLINATGEVFSYTSAYVDILSQILTQAARMSTRAFGEKYLFGPMGIKVLGWSRNAKGYYLGESELFLTSRDMAKIGWLFVNQGRYKKKQLISQKWIEESTRARIAASDGNGEYGYLWWVKSKARIPFSYAWGYGGQYIYLVPNKGMVVVMTNNFDQRRPQNAIRSIIEESILAAAPN